VEQSCIVVKEVTAPLLEPVSTHTASAISSVAHFIPILMISFHGELMVNLSYPSRIVPVSDFYSFSMTHNTRKNNEFLFKFLFRFPLKIVYLK